MVYYSVIGKMRKSEFYLNNIPFHMFYVGETGFEPATSCSQSKHSNLAELLPVKKEVGGKNTLYLNPPTPLH